MTSLLVPLSTTGLSTPQLSDIIHSLTSLLIQLPTTALPTGSVPNVIPSLPAAEKLTPFTVVDRQGRLSITSLQIPIPTAGLGTDSLPNVVSSLPKPVKSLDHTGGINIIPSVTKPSLPVSLPTRQPKVDSSLPKSVTSIDHNGGISIIPGLQTVPSLPILLLPPTASPGTSKQPVSLGKPASSSQTSTSGKATTSKKPAGLGQSGNSDKAASSGQPTKSEKPATSGQPASSGNPTSSTQPANGHTTRPIVLMNSTGGITMIHPTPTTLATACGVPIKTNCKVYVNTIATGADASNIVCYRNDPHYPLC
jgi:hypothetical protein